MSKKLIGILLVVCMVIGLLPMIAIAAEPKTAKVIIMNEIELVVTEGGPAAYTKNKEYTAFGSTDGTTPAEGNPTFTAYGQELGTADNWNIKFEYPTGGTPTVTLRDAKLDNFDNEKSLFEIIKNADGTWTPTKSKATGFKPQSVIMPGDVSHDLRVVLEGSSFVELNCGFVLSNVSEKISKDTRCFKNMYFASVGTGKITVTGLSGIGIMGEPGTNITFESANIDISTTEAGSNACPINLYSGKIIFNGGNIKLKNAGKNPAIYAAGTEAEIIINGGNLDVECFTNGSTAGTGVINNAATDGYIYVNGGNITIFGGDANRVNTPAGLCAAKGTVVMNGGNVIITQAYVGFGKCKVEINGGEIEINATQRAFYQVPDYVQSSVTGKAGASADLAAESDPFDAAALMSTDSGKYGQVYMKLSGAPYGPATTQPSVPVVTAQPTQPATQATQAPTSAPTTAPTTAPTQPATQATQAPTQATQGTTNPPTGDNGVMMFVVLMAAAMFGIVATVSFGKKHA